MELKVTGQETLSDILKITASIYELVEESGGELTPIIEQSMTDIATLTGNKVDAYKAIQDSLNAQAERLEEQAKKLLHASQSLSTSSKAIKDRLKFLMETHEITELNGNFVKYKLVDSAFSCEITDESQIPESFVRTITETRIDRKAIIESLKQGLTVPGAELRRAKALKETINKGK